jgi:hypothetical protein
MASLVICYLLSGFSHANNPIGQPVFQLCHTISALYHSSRKTCIANVELAGGVSRQDADF